MADGQKHCGMTVTKRVPSPPLDMLPAPPPDPTDSEPTDEIEQSAQSEEAINEICEHCRDAIEDEERLAMECVKLKATLRRLKADVEKASAGEGGSEGELKRMESEHERRMKKVRRTVAEEQNNGQDLKAGLEK